MAGDHGWAEQWHPVLVEAWATTHRVIRPDRRGTLYRPTFEDAVQEAAVALITDQDPVIAARRVVADDRAWLMRTAPLMEDIA